MTRLVWGIVCLLVWQSALALELPAALKDWQAWTLDRLEYRNCPLQAGGKGEQPGDYLCAWPGQLKLSAAGDGAEFELDWQLYAKGWVALPGDGEHWPREVRVNGQPAAVVSHEGGPALFLAAGRYQFKGRFDWQRRPQSLSIPTSIALIRLQVDGQRIAPVQRESNALVLGRAASEAPEADAIDLRVFRRLADGLPAELETRLQLAVAGEAREILLGPVLPPGFVATELEIDSDWPVRMQADGRLRIQAQPDYAEISLLARAVTPLSSVALPAIEAPWPSQEVWSYEPEPSLRISAVDGERQVDPGQAGVPAEWTELPSYALQAADRLNIEQRSRGLGPEQGNRLGLSRQAWLDYDGQGWSFRDQLNGQMLRDWRLDLRSPLLLDSARSNADQQYLLITRAADGGTGIEWRTPAVDLVADLRLEDGSWQWPAGGWNNSFDRIDTTLNLPFGYKLLAAPGADQAEGSWVGSWNLLQLFIAALIALFAWRLLGLPGGLLALGYLLISHGEGGAPLWTLATLLALGLIHRHLPDGRLRKWVGGTRYLAGLALLWIALPFAADQLRLALHPQLEQGRSWYPASAERGRAARIQADAPAPPPPPPMPMPAAAPMAEADAAVLDRIEITGSRIKRADILETYSSTSIIQAGRGLPSWQGGQRYLLRWSGPILAEQELRLWLSPPWLTRMLRVLAVIGLALLLWQIAGRPRPRLRGATAAVPLLCLGLLAAAPAEAQNTPDPALLQELGQRLTRPADCAPDCLALAEADLQLNDQGLQLRLKLHALALTTVALPSDPLSLSIERLSLDGKPLGEARQIRQAPSVVVERGVHLLEIDYRIDADRIALAFPLRPYRLAVQAEEWQVSGMSEHRLLTEALRLSRLRKLEGAASSSAPAQLFPPYVRVERQLSFGLDWTVWTRVHRLAPSEGGFSISLPLLAGERVQSSQFKVRDGRIEVAVADGESEVAWNSMLDKSEALSLVAGDLAAYAERWQVVVSPMWSAQLSGLPESLPEPDRSGDDWHAYQFDPLPGESLNISIQRPEAVQGETQAIDQVTQVSELGRRATDHQLSFNLRATQGGERRIQLAEGVELLGVSRNQQALGLRLEQGQLSLPVQPGEQRFDIRYRETTELGSLARTPAVDLGLPSANIRLNMQLPRDRWVWLAFGPDNGPAVLIWGELLVLIGLVFGLSRLRWTPLKFQHWLLLGLGFALFSWAALLTVAGWLLALGWRQRRGEQIANRFAFAAMQIALVGLTLAAAVALISAIPNGLLGQPDMGVVGNGSDAHRLQWFADQSESALPQASAFSLPLWAYRSAMLIWALWLANALLGWLRWAGQCFATGGMWRRLRKPKPSAEPTAESAPDDTAS